MQTERKSLAPWIRDDVAFYPHQIEGIRHLARISSWLLADDMGLGKSVQTLTVFGIDVARGWATSMLVVCPVSLKGNWADEIEKFTGFRYMVLEGTPKERLELLRDFFRIGDEPKILIVNYEQVIPHIDHLNKLKFDCIAFDEAHYMKNHKAKRTKACHKLKADRIFELTGTPLLNRVDELWSLLHRIAPAEFPSYWSFVRRYAVFGGFKDKQIVGVKNEAELTRRLHAYMLRRMKSEVLDLPEVQIVERRVDLLPEQKKLYIQVADELLLDRYDLNKVDEIDNALTKFLRLKQICGTTAPFTGEDHSAKLDLAVEDDEEILSNGHKIVVFTQFRSVLQAYINRAAKLGYPIFQLHGDVKMNQRSEIVKSWGMTDGPAILVCMLQVAGIGLNMTASRHASFLDELFVPGLNQQAIDRLHRIGASTTQPITVRKYICRGTVENRIQTILRTKVKTNKDIIEVDHNWKRKLVMAMLEDDND